ncbi:diaminopimelate decarboxylase [Marinicellulosiphila megalodicopiae]|uniref:diaminopimelate decarboxylase n=1 Tax=Marinicellulosiphila megalodicopiae TaxID=2724896 RepID=UPI003BB1A027
MLNLEYKNGEQYIEGLSISQLADRHETPFYCYSATKVQTQFRMFKDAFSNLDALVCYAVKVNSNQAILTLLADEGAGADVVSIGEIKRALAANIPANKIVFSGVAKTKEEMVFALQQNILCFNVESKPELDQLASVAFQLKITANISFRINPNVDANTHKKISTGKKGDKFGVDIDQAVSLYQYAQSLSFINIVGIDMHIGSQISDMNAFDLAIVKIKKLYEQLNLLNIKIQHIDFGGGLAVQYQRNDKTESDLLIEYARVINKHAIDLDCKIIFEPGRFIMGNAGVLVTKVIVKKYQHNKVFLIVDAGMNDLIRPTLYDAYHVISPANYSNEMESVDVVGPVCETGDYLAQDRTMQKVEQGELIIIHSTGAYCAVTSNSYNSRPIIKEVLVKNNCDYVIRKEQTVESLIALDCVPVFLNYLKYDSET